MRMVRYCTNGDCSRSEHPLPPHSGVCPECGNTEQRIDPSVSANKCRECDAPNADAQGDCWNCGATLDDQSRSISFD